MVTIKDKSIIPAGLDLTDVEETSLLTLYARAIESRSADPILVDPEAERIVGQVDRVIAGTQDPLLRSLYEKKVDPRLAVHIALRAQKYDRYSLEFLSRHPGGIIVNLGCGMDTRFQRIDDGEMLYFDLDLPEVIGLKSKFLQETGRYRFISSDVFDTDWLEEVAAVRGENPVLFLAEGLFMYLDPEKVKDLVLNLQKRFPGSELVCEVVGKMWVKGFFKKIVAWKMQSRLNIGRETEYRFGLASPDEMESWHAGIQFLDRWSYFDTDHPKIGSIRTAGKLKFMRAVQYTVHYRLNP